MKTLLPILAALLGCGSSDPLAGPSYEVPAWTGEDSAKIGGDLEVVDLGGDGWPDLFVSSYGSDGSFESLTRECQVYALEGPEPPRGAIQGIASVVWAGDRVRRDCAGPMVAAGDLTGDGAPDLVFGVSDPAGPVEVHILGGAGGSSASVTGATEPAVCGDLDGDGTSDLCARGAVLYGPITGAIDVAEAELTVSLADADVLLTAADVDGDGVPELVHWRPGEGLWLLPATTTGEVALDEGTLWSSADETLAAFALGDLDGDGLRDVLVLDSGGARLLPHTASGTLDAAPYVVTWDEGAWFRNAISADFDGDGAEDLVVSNYGRGVSVFAGPLTGPRDLDDADVTLDEGLDASPELFGAGLAAGDLNQSGVLDLLIGDPSAGNQNEGAIYVAPAAGLR